MTQFRDAIRSPITRDRYEKRLDLFFKFIGIEGSSLEERAKAFTPLRLGATLTGPLAQLWHI